MPNKDLYCPNKIFDNNKITIGEFRTYEEAMDFPLHEIWCINRSEDNKFRQ